jgi:prefoldin subunit 5
VKVCKQEPEVTIDELAAMNELVERMDAQITRLVRARRELLETREELYAVPSRTTLRLVAS